MFGVSVTSLFVRLVLAVLALMTVLPGIAVAQPAPPGPQSVFELMRLGPDVYTFRSIGHVSMFITTSEGVILVDPVGQSNPQSPSVLKEAIAAVTDQPVRYVVYSHWGADHGTGGVVFADTATFVSHSRTAPKIAAANDPTSPVPDLTFEDHLGIVLGETSVDLYHANLGPEDEYLLVHYPAGRIIMTVDYLRPQQLVFGNFGNTNPEWLVERLEWIDQQLEWDRFVWGHGAGPTSMGTHEDLRAFRQYIIDLMAAVRNARGAGLADNSEAMVEAVRAELAPSYGSWGNFGNGLAANISGVIGWWARS
jgi:glyoxylase-like metal-dependent hydrolase (beta-lactamase superfamily II)